MRRRVVPAKINTVSFGFRVGRGRQHRMEAADQHNEIEIDFVERGELTLRNGLQASTLRQGNAAVYWAAIPHQVIAVAPDTEIVWLAVPLARFLSWNLSSTLSTPLLRGDVLPLPQRIGHAEVGELLRQWADDFVSLKREWREIPRLEIEAFFLRLACRGKFRPIRDNARTVSPAQKSHDAGRVEKMVLFMTEHVTEEISVPQIAAAAKLNPAYAMRLFHRSWGMTLWDFLLQQRVFRAKRLLVLGDAKVSDVAFECGFSSVSRFYSAFAKYCGCSPLAFRHRSLKSNPPGIAL